MNFIRFWALFLLLPVTLQAQIQKKDSLENRLNHTNDSAKRYDLLNKLAPLLINFEQPQKAIVYFEELQRLARQKGDYKNEAKAYRGLSMIYQNKGNYTTAIKLIEKATKIDDKNHCIRCYLLDINQLGRIYIDLQKPRKALEIYQEAVRKAGNQSDPKILSALAIIYGNIGIAYGKIYQKEKEINAFLKQAALAEKAGNYNEKSKALYNTGYLYMEMEQYHKAEKYFFKAMSDSLRMSNKDYVKINYHSLGELYSRWKKFNLALHYDSLALDYFKNNGYSLYVFDVLNNIAVVYQRMNRYDKAIPFHLKAIKLADSLNHKLIQIGGKLSYVNSLIHLKKYQEAENILKQLAKDTIDHQNFNKSLLADFWEYNFEVYKHQKNYQKSLEYFERYHDLRDSLTKRERDIKIAELETKYQTEVKEKELAQKEKELLKQKIVKQRLTFGLSVIGILLILISFIAIRTYKKHLDEKRKLNELVKKVKELTRILETTGPKIIEQKSGLQPVPLDDIYNIHAYYKKSKKLQKFYAYLQEKVNINKPILIEVWESIANGVSRKEFTDKFGYNENTVKAWRKELYQILKDYEQTSERYTDYKATGLYYRILLEFLFENKIL